MASEESQVKKAAELKLWLESRISQLQDEMDRLRESLTYVDATLRASAFRPAIEMVSDQAEVPERRELKRDKGGQVIATASITPDVVAIEPKTGVELKVSTPPFRSFLLGKILKGMETKDQQLAASGKLLKGSELKFDVEEANGSLSRLVVENYRDSRRLGEILSTTSWTFSRMLEK